MLRGRRLPVSPCQLPRCGIEYRGAAATARRARFISHTTPLTPKGPPPKLLPATSHGSDHSGYSAQMQTELQAWEAERQQQIRQALNTPANRPDALPASLPKPDVSRSYMDSKADKFFPDVESTMREIEKEVEFRSLRLTSSGQEPWATSGDDVWSHQRESEHTLQNLQRRKKRLNKKRRQASRIRKEAFEAARTQRLKVLEEKTKPQDPYLARLAAMGHQPFVVPKAEKLRPYMQTPPRPIYEFLQKPKSPSHWPQDGWLQRTVPGQKEAATSTLDEPDHVKLEKIAANSAVVVGLRLKGSPLASSDDEASFVKLDEQPTWVPFQKLDPGPRRRQLDKFKKRAKAKPALRGPAGLTPQEEAIYQTQKPTVIDVSQLELSQPASMMNLDQGSNRWSFHGVTSEDTPSTVHSIFSMLFPTKPHTDRSSISQTSPYGPSRDPVSMQPTQDMDPRKKNFVDVPTPSLSAPGSIFNQLFPDSAEPSKETTTSDDPVKEQNPLNKDEDALLVSLRNEVRNWIPEEDRDTITAPQPGQYGSQSTVVIISGLSNTLVDSDFYRIIPEGRHVEGWAGGLVKCVQARHSLTYEPLGQYYLMFHSRPSAEAFVKEVQRLHHLSRRLLTIQKAKAGISSSSSSSPDRPSAPPPLTEAEYAAVQSFTLFPPRITPKIHIHMWGTKLIAQLAQRNNIADVVQALKPEAETPAKVLLLFNSGSATPAEGLTVAELWLTLRDDGRERGVPWAMINLKDGIRPVRLGYYRTSRAKKISFRRELLNVDFSGEKVFADELEMAGRAMHRLSPQYDAALYEETNASLKDVTALGEAPPGDEAEFGDDYAGGTNTSANGNSKEQGKGKDKDKRWSKKSNAVRPDERFSRYILTFKQRAIARRFVRCWHKRPIWDPETKRAVVVDAVAFM
ncbi:hypothetical protein BD289DRAFT_423509 [Coniella lustricola]|uniref:Uncharacterized protein n=1 Tax=Coniella lustricola TaxID=2025994 RepID=A0A2T3AJ90_9PEZI|nr:hypothetical protein BD289DRAFT_423509 [Coniella lustricola]